MQGREGGGGGVGMGTLAYVASESLIRVEKVVK